MWYTPEKGDDYLLLHSSPSFPRWFNPEKVDDYLLLCSSTRQGEIPQLWKDVISDLLENFWKDKNSPKVLGKYVQHGGIFSLPELNKLHNLSLENEEFKAIYTFYMDEKLDINTIDEHTNLVRETWGRDKPILSTS